MNEKSSQTITNFLWRFLERCGAQGVTFVVSLVLARLLDPGVYGTIALVTVFTAIMQVFVDSGFANALIQKKDADNVDFSTVFYFNMAVCAMLYAVMFFAAYPIARFYGDGELVPIIRVMSLSLIIGGVKNVQQAYVSRNMLFKKFFFATLGGTVGAAVIGVFMAYRGFGVWALICQNLFNQTVDTLILWITVKWRPIKAFSATRLRQMFSYGWKLLVSSLLDTLYNNLRTLIIGKKYSSEDLAFYNKGNHFPNLIVTNINSSIDSVLLPTLSASQDDPSAVRAMTRRAIKTSSYIMLPLMTGLAVCAKPLVSLLLTDKWLECVPYMRIFCFTYAFYPIHTANLNAIKAMGRSDLFLRLEITKKIIGLAAVGISMWFGVFWMAFSLVITALISQLINAYPNKSLLGYSYLSQIKDILPQITLSCVMGVAVYLVGLLAINTALLLLIQVVLGAVIYISLSALLKLESFVYIRNIAKKFLKKSDV